MCITMPDKLHATMIPNHSMPRCWLLATCTHPLHPLRILVAHVQCCHSAGDGDYTAHQDLPQLPQLYFETLEDVLEQTIQLTAQSGPFLLQLMLRMALPPSIQVLA